MGSPVAKSLPPALMQERVRLMLAFYGLAPVVTGLLFGMNHSGSARELSTPGSVIYWMGIAFIFWLVLDLSSRACLAVLKPWKPPVWAGLLAGSILAMVAFAPILQVYSREVFALLADPDTAYSPPRTVMSAGGDVVQLLKFSVVPAYWLTLTWVFGRLFGYPGYLAAYRPAPSVSPVLGAAAQTVPAREGLFAEIPARLGLDVISLHAEDHYVRVCTRLGDTLIRYRFNDAIKEAARLGGVQVHRSHWVRVEAVDAVLTEDGARRLRLKNGMEIPVSRTYLGVLKAVGLI
ncbi:MAG: LytTR family DNA-binding domain-containing protein [Oceanicaulis sp.]